LTWKDCDSSGPGFSVGQKFKGTELYHLTEVSVTVFSDFLAKKIACETIICGKLSSEQKT
jgi:hypothetical protein